MLLACQYISLDSIVWLHQNPNTPDSGVQTMESEKDPVNSDLREEALHYRYHGKLSIAAIAEKLGKSERTIYRWLKGKKKPQSSCQQNDDDRGNRCSQYSGTITEKIIEFKQQNPRRSARIIRNCLMEEELAPIPSESTIRRILVEKGMGKVAAEARRGYVCFEREQPNELWQVDIAGVQTVGHLGSLYLFALLDDCSRFVPAAFYTADQRGVHVMRLLQQAITDFGRPIAIVADNGAQFRTLLKGIESQYEKILKMLDIQPIFAKAHHPQTKGKLERFFGSVKTMFLAEARFQAKSHPEWTLSDFNQQFSKWLGFYNTEHRHRAHLGKETPQDVYFGKSSRIHRPLEIEVDWNKWMCRVEKRKVTKTNLIHFQNQRFSVPIGFAGLLVDLQIYPDFLEIHRKGAFLISHSLDRVILDKKSAQTRRIARNGTIGFQGQYYNVNYKRAGQEVTVQESSNGTELLIYYREQLIKRIEK